MIILSLVCGVLLAVAGAVLFLAGSGLALGLLVWPLAHDSAWRGHSVGGGILRASGGRPGTERPNRADVFAPLVDHLRQLATATAASACVTALCLGVLSVLP